MGLESHIQELADKHHKLDEQIHDEQLRPHPDDLMLSELKKRKLRIKEEIERQNPKSSVRRRGNDLFVGKRKLSVAIATASPTSATAG